MEIEPDRKAGGQNHSSQLIISEVVKSLSFVSGDIASVVNGERYALLRTKSRLPFGSRKDALGLDFVPHVAF